MTDRVYIWFADNGNIRKWSREPFEEATAYLAALPVPDLAEWEKAAEGVTPTRDGDLMRYEHGGGRLAILRDGERTLVADFYSEVDREWYTRCSPDNVLSALRSLSARLAEAERERDTLTKRLAEMEAGR